jgi:hypothetical protein
LAADENGVGIEQPLHGRASVERLEAVEHPAAALQRVPGVGQYVLETDDHARQRAGGASGPLGVDGIGLGSRLVGPHFEEGVEVLLALDVAQIILNELTAGRSARRQLVTNFG